MTLLLNKKRPTSFETSSSSRQGNAIGLEANCIALSQLAGVQGPLIKLSIARPGFSPRLPNASPALFGATTLCYAPTLWWGCQSSSCYPCTPGLPSEKPYSHVRGGFLLVRDGTQECCGRGELGNPGRGVRQPSSAITAHHLWSSGLDARVLICPSGHVRQAPVISVQSNSSIWKPKHSLSDKTSLTSPCDYRTGDLIPGSPLNGCFLPFRQVRQGLPFLTPL